MRKTLVKHSLRPNQVYHTNEQWDSNPRPITCLFSQNTQYNYLTTQESTKSLKEHSERCTSDKVRLRLTAAERNMVNSENRSLDVNCRA